MMNAFNNQTDLRLNSGTMWNRKIKTLSDILVQLNESKGSNFRGVGLLLYQSLAHVPIAPLRDRTIVERENLPISGTKRIVSALLRYGDEDNQFHDGFHLISRNLNLTHISQYFSPPIVAMVSPEMRYGGRYRAAFYGSFIPSVIATGVLSQSYGPTLFIRGNVRVHLDK